MKNALGIAVVSLHISERGLGHRFYFVHLSRQLGETLQKIRCLRHARFSMRVACRGRIPVNVLELILLSWGQLGNFTPPRGPV